MLATVSGHLQGNCCLYHEIAVGQDWDHYFHDKDEAKKVNNKLGVRYGMCWCICLFVLLGG